MLSPSELECLGQFLPLAVVGHLQRAAFNLLQHIDRVALCLQRGCQVFATIVVDQLKGGRLTAIVDFCRGDQPAEGVVLFPQVTGQFAVEILSGDGDVLSIEIDSEIYLIFFINKVRAKWLFALLGDGGQQHEYQHQCCY